MFRYLFFILLSFILTVSGFSSPFADHFAGAQLAIESEKNPIAIEELNIALKSWKSSDGLSKKAQAYSLRGGLYIGEKKYDLAIADYQRALKINPKDGRVYYDIGLIYMAQDNNPDAISNLKKSIELDTKFQMAHWTLGNIYKKTRRFTEAANCYADCTTLDPKSVSYYASLGDMLYEQKKYDSAIDILKKAVEMNPNHAIAYYNLGLSYVALGKFKEAVPAYEHALTARVIIMDALKVQILISLGTAYEHIGEKEKGEQCIKKARELLDKIPTPADKKQ